MIPVEVTVLALLIFMAWQSIFGWVKDRAQQKEIDELKLALLDLKRTVDEYQLERVALANRRVPSSVPEPQ